MAEAAQYHAVTGCLYRSLKKVPEAQPDVLADLRRHRRTHALAHLRTLSDLRLLDRIFGEAAIPWLVVKGPVLAESVYTHSDLRTYRDLDVLVPPGQFPAALETLEEGGGRLLDRNWPLLYREMKGELHVVLPSGTVVDLHWHLVNDRRVREAIGVPSVELFERTRTVDVGGTPVVTLDPTATLVYVALHACLAGGERLVWLKDIEQLVLNQQVEWARVLETARWWGVSLPVATTLDRSRRILGAPIPVEVVRALGRGWVPLVR
ncbi:MAG: nucleotidyltransferase family protein, partial [Acidimicrobiia bacterium]